MAHKMHHKTWDGHYMNVNETYDLQLTRRYTTYVCSWTDHRKIDGDWCSNSWAMDGKLKPKWMDSWAYGQFWVCMASRLGGEWSGVQTMLLMYIHMKKGLYVEDLELQVSTTDCWISARMYGLLTMQQQYQMQCSQTNEAIKVNSQLINGAAIDSKSMHRNDGR